MSHTRIRPFNTRDTYPEQNLDNDLCQAVVAGDTIYLRGQIGQDLDTGRSVGVGDVEAQAEQAMRNADTLLREAGSELADIVKVVIYLVDPRYREIVYRVIGKWLRGVHPVSTGIVVSALARPEWLVEIDITAVRAPAPAATAESGAGASGAAESGTGSSGTGSSGAAESGAGASGAAESGAARPAAGA